MKTPTWREIEEFCRKDGWELTRSTDHVFFRKILSDGSVLETHRSFADDKSMSPGRFIAILRVQLKVSPDDFWETLRTGRPAPLRFLLGRYVSSAMIWGCRRRTSWA